MTRKPIVATALASVFFGSSAFAQQPEPAPAPVPPAPPSVRVTPGAGMGQGLGRSSERKMVIERHVISEGGPHAELRMGPPGIWWRNPEIIQKLTITPDQQKRMDNIFQQSRLQLIDLKAAVEKQEVLLEPMLAANPPDTNKVLAQIDRAAQARAELEKANAKMLLGIRTVLTPDQWTKLQAEERGNRRMIFNYKMKPGGPEGPGEHEHLFGPGEHGNSPGPGSHSGPSGPETMLILPPLPNLELRLPLPSPEPDVDF